MKKLGFWKTASIGLVVIFLSSASAQKPNILWIMAEDMNPDLGVYGNTEVNTPNIDRLASQGVTYTNAYSVNPVCSPSSTSTVTGMYPNTIGGHQHRTPNKQTIMSPVRHFSHLLKEAGYFVGRMGSTKTDYNFTNANVTWDGNDWRARGNKPFFIYYKYSETHRGGKCNNAPKVVNNGDVIIPPIYYDSPTYRADRAKYLNCVASLDDQVGGVLTRLENDGLTDNTIVVFHSDHGRPQFRAKQWLYDGGVHIPMVIRWPNKISPNIKRDNLVSLIDLTATSLTIAGATLPSHMEGKVFLETTGANVGDHIEIRDHVMLMRDKMDHTMDRIRGVRTKRFKYIRNYYPELPYTQPNNYKDTQYPPYAEMKTLFANGQLNAVQAAYFQPTKPVEELYDLAADPWETKNLAADPDYCDTMLVMRERLQDWLQRKDPQLGYQDKGAVPMAGMDMWVIKPLNDGTGRIWVMATVADAQGRNINARIEYSTNGGNSWNQLAIDSLVAEYGSPTLDNNRNQQINGLSTSETGANTFRFLWNTKSNQNGGGALGNQVYNSVQLRVNPSLGATFTNAVITGAGTAGPTANPGNFTVDNTQNSGGLAALDFLPPALSCNVNIETKLPTMDFVWKEVNGIINISSNSIIQKVEVFDLQGRVVFSESNDMRHMEIYSNWNPGLYIVKIYTGIKKFHKTLLVQNNKI